MAVLHLEKIKTDCAGFRALGAEAVADGLLGIFGHHSLQLCFGSLMLQKGLPGAPKETGKFSPGVRAAHINDPNRFDPGFGRFNSKQARGLAALDAAPELSLCSDDKVLVERIGMGGDLDPSAAAGNDRQDRGPPRYHPHIVLQLRRVVVNLIEIGKDWELMRFGAQIRAARALLGWSQSLPVSWYRLGDASAD